jgi:hypothetical protein
MSAEDDDFGGLDDERDPEDERFPHDEELDDDERDDDGQGWAWPAGGYPPPPPAGPSGPRRRPLVLIVTAVVAAAAGFGVVAAALHDAAGHDGSGSPAAASGTPSGGTPGPAASPSMLPPQYRSGPGQTLPTPGSGQQLELVLGGRVTAVSATSITIGAGSRAVTATVTKATRITGKVTSIAGIRVGDMVSATITGTDGKLTAGTIQDPASLP